MASAPRPLTDILALSEADFTQLLANVYEKSPEIARKVYSLGPFASVTVLASALASEVRRLSEEDQRRLVCGYPELAGDEAGKGRLYGSARLEQDTGLHVSKLTEEEVASFSALNAEYRAKFGFTFLLALKNLTPRSALAAFQARLRSTYAEELTRALAEADKIAWMRLLDLIVPAPTGYLTCHVLDTTRGKPAAGMVVQLRRADGSAFDGSFGGTAVKEFVTNSDGRLDGKALEGSSFRVGVYEWTFKVGDYFAGAGVATAGQPFLDVVPLRFGIDNPEEHYHVPLLCSPWSYSTYRGS